MILSIWTAVLGSSPRDAGNYIAALPKAVSGLAHWQLATEQLLDAAEGRNFLMHARIAMMKALNHGKTLPGPRVRRAKAYRIVS